MEIIKRGSIPGEREHEVTCYRCKTVFRFKEHEAQKHYDQRDGDYLSIDCPVCDGIVTKNVY